MNTKHLKLISVLSSALLLAACASAPMGPSVQVMPGSHKPFEIFQQDQEQCKTYAHSQIAGQVDAANNKAVGQAALGVLLGGLAGAAVGNHQSAGVGSAVGLMAGTGAGAGTAQNAQMSIQQQFDNAYMQCMYARHNQVPGMTAELAASAPTPNGTASPPPPPSGIAPPPPPGVAASAGPATRGMTVAQAQARLNTIGYPIGRPTGVVGPKTTAALKDFQKDRGLPQTGQLDSATIAELGN